MEQVDITLRRRRYRRRRPLLVMAPEFVPLDDVHRRQGLAALTDLFARYLQDRSESPENPDRT